MFKYAVLAITGFVNAQKFNATNLNSTAPAYNSTYFTPMADCQAYQTCDQTIQNVTGQNTAGAACYKFGISDTPYYNKTWVGIANGLQQQGFPTSGQFGPQYVFKCLTPNQLQSGMNGNFTHIPSQQKCDSYEQYDQYSGRYETKESCYTDPAKWQVPNATFGRTNLTYQIISVSQSNVQLQNGQEVSNFYMTESRDGLSADAGRYSRITTVRQKIMDYFYYAIVQGNSVNTDYGNCSASCGQGIFKQQCCGEFSTVQKNFEYGPQGQVAAPDTKDVFYVCINQSIAAADMTLNVMDVSVGVTCAQNTMSGAMRLVSASALALLAFVAI